MKYKHLSIEEREKIQELLWQKTSIRSIAKVIGRSPSSIARELKKNKPILFNRYTPRIANEKALDKRKSRGRKDRLKTKEIREYVILNLKQGWSPEQISGRIKIELRENISHEAIYQFIYNQIHRDGYGYTKPNHEDLRIFLKRRHKRRVIKGMRKGQRIFKHKGISIEERPKYIEKRKSIGHWEGDSVVSRKSTVGLNTLVERKTGLVFISKIKDKTMEETSNTVIDRLKNIPCKTLTLDNGTENFGYEKIQNELKISCFFAHPYCSGERGTNENTNGLIRWYFPKKTDFANISEEAIQAVERALNNRPRKRLGWKTPLEVFNESVALIG
ncbi:MAG: IS30 family transposase [Candidatus Moranbacteria bacterium]|nr:IS30 family transposase [Candidatus Moranbacteria bacterium]